MAQVADLADDHPLPPASDIAPPKKSASSPKPTAAAAALARAREQYAKAGVALTRARDRADDLSRHPHALRAREIAETQLNALRKVLLKSDTVKDTVELTKLDPAVIVFGTLTFFLVFIWYDLFNIAFPVTTAVIFARPAYHAILALDDRHAPPEDVDNTLAAFVLLGLVQTVEAFFGRALVAVIPHYFVLKLALFYYLNHPRLQGAAKVHDKLLKNLVATSPPFTPSPLPRPDQDLSPQKQQKLYTPKSFSKNGYSTSQL
ncbi:Protein YOP1 [Vanrija pseudolonga]|uniref:Protein YOP1 n=1 Tax=Vanrija pseudolonga TaxID=143232 RepID=A0AAF1BKB9_9TREE|nr:Protein YOP1 [Vanrija pseudolonga]